MNIIGEYSIQYDIYTMFNVYNVKIKNHNLITRKGYEFFLKKWYKDEVYPFELGYYNEGDFYEQKNIDDTYSYKLSDSDGLYSKSVNYIDRDTYKQYRWNGEEFVDFNEKLDKIIIGDYPYVNEVVSRPKDYDNNLYNQTYEYRVESDEFILNSTELVMKCTVNKEELDGATEIGVKTNQGVLVSHDIHAPYNLPFGTDIILEYAFKLEKED